MLSLFMHWSILRRALDGRSVPSATRSASCDEKREWGEREGSGKQRGGERKKHERSATKKKGGRYIRQPRQLLQVDRGGGDPQHSSATLGVVRLADGAPQAGGGAVKVRHQVEQVANVHQDGLSAMECQGRQGRMPVKKTTQTTGREKGGRGMAERATKKEEEEEEKVASQSKLDASQE